MMNSRPGLLSIGDFIGYVETHVPPEKAVPWFLVQVKAGSERTIAEYLRRYHFPVYAPLTQVMKPVAQRHLSHKQRQAGAVVRRPVIRPLFQGYQFVGIDMETQHRWHDIFKLRGVRGLVCTDDLPARVPAAMIDKIKSCEINGVVPGHLKLLDVMKFAIGEKVRVTGLGPFSTFDGVIEELPKDYLDKVRNNTIEELDESMPVTLLLNIFGRSTPVQLPVGQIEKV